MLLRSIDDQQGCAAEGPQEEGCISSAAATSEACFWAAYESDPGSQLKLDVLERQDMAGQGPSIEQWFESIHPFDDGNGRIGRAIVDMAVAQHLHQSVRLYSLSRQLLASHSGYYDSLNAAQRGDLDVTARVRWFARQCTAAYESASQVIDRALEKRHFWDRHEGSGLNERQRKSLQRLLDAGDGGFEGGTNADKYIKISANALRLTGVGRSAFMESAQAPAGQVAFSDLSLFRELQRIVHLSNVTGSLPAACVSRWMSCTGARRFPNRKRLSDRRMSPRSGRPRATGFGKASPAMPGPA